MEIVPSENSFINMGTKIEIPDIGQVGFEAKENIIVPVLIPVSLPVTEIRDERTDKIWLSLQEYSLTKEQMSIGLQLLNALLPRIDTEFHLLHDGFRSIQPDRKNGAIKMTWSLANNQLCMVCKKSHKKSNRVWFTLFLRTSKISLSCTTVNHLQSIFSKNKCGALKRKLDWDLSYENWQQLTDQPCSYCGSSSSKRRTGLDRMNNKKGYYLENVTPACWECNRAKNTRTVEEYVRHCFQVSQHMSQMHALMLQIQDISRDNK